MRFLFKVLIFVGIVAFLLMGAVAGVFLVRHMGTPAADATSVSASTSAQPQVESSVCATVPEAQKQLYNCPMHPSYTSEKPGDCPICNMSLVPMKPAQVESTASNVEGHATVTISLEGQQLIGVQTGIVVRKDVKKSIRAVGAISYNERTLATVSLKYSGWVEELRVKATGDTIREGAPFLVVYSPDFLEAQRNYILALESSDALGRSAGSDASSFADESVKSARERLLLWDMSASQLKELDQSRQPQKDIMVLSKVTGTVIERNVTEGDYVESGKELYKIADLSTVWIEANFYENEIPLVKVGDDVKVTLASYPGEEISGKLAYVYPYLNKETRTVRVRFEMPNPDGKLKPGMYATVFLEADLGEQLVVDDSAILDTGARQIVFVVSARSVFEPREVVAGERADGQAIILKGLTEGEKIVTSGNFLVDSESRLKSAGAGGGMAGMPGMEMPSTGGQGGNQGGGKENMPGMGAPAQQKGGGMEEMPGMSMPAPVESTGGMEATPGMDMPAQTGGRGSMNDMPGTSAPATVESTAGMEGMPDMPGM